MATAVSAMRQPVGHRECGSPDIHQGCDPFQLVVPASVKEIADPDHPGGLAGEVDRQRRGAAAENPGHRIQFHSAVSQIGASHGKVRYTKSGNRRE